MKKYLFLSVAIMLGALTMTSCSDDDDNKTTDETYKDRTFGNEAIDACATTVSVLESANQTIASANLSAEQESALRQVLVNLVNNVIVPTYTQLADDVEDLEKTLGGLTVSTGSVQRLSLVAQHQTSASTPLLTHGHWTVPNCLTTSRVA